MNRTLTTILLVCFVSLDFLSTLLFMRFVTLCIFPECIINSHTVPDLRERACIWRGIMRARAYGSISPSTQGVVLESKRLMYELKGKYKSSI